MDKMVLHKEIDLIQSCISRMAHDSFLVKGWTITLLAAIWALTIHENAVGAVSAISLGVIMSFWYLDAFFLRTEKMYRKMYEWVIVERNKNNEEYLYDLNPHRFAVNVDSTVNVMFSITLRCFYGIPFLLILASLVWQILMQDFGALCHCK